MTKSVSTGFTITDFGGSCIVLGREARFLFLAQNGELRIRGCDASDARAILTTLAQVATAAPPIAIDDVAPVKAEPPSGPVTVVNISGVGHPVGRGTPAPAAEEPVAAATPEAPAAAPEAPAQAPRRRTKRGTPAQPTQEAPAAPLTAADAVAMAHGTEPDGGAPDPEPEAEVAPEAPAAAVEAEPADDTEAATEAEAGDGAEAVYDIEVLKAASTLRAVLEHLFSRGVTTKAALVDLCTKIKADVPVLSRVANLGERIDRALTVMGHAA